MMRYRGGKSRLAGKILPHLRESLDHGRPNYLEPFLGGAAMFTKAIPHVPGVAVGNDLHPDLMLMWKAVKDGWMPPAPDAQDAITPEDWHRLKAETTPSALRGFVGFGLGFGGSWFEKYNLDTGMEKPYGESYRTLLKQQLLLRLENVKLLNTDYQRLSSRPSWTIYADPPYANTSCGHYGGFDHSAFYDWCGAQVCNGAYVLISEYQMPSDHFEVVDEFKVQTSIGSQQSNAHARTEGLFKVKGSTPHA